LDLPHAVQFALRLLMVASEFDSATGGVNPETNTYATIKILTSQGIEAVDPEQQGEYLRV
jgi:proteasome beta subunit